jgi:hypothetical protein
MFGALKPAQKFKFRRSARMSVSSLALNIHTSPGIFSALKQASSGAMSVAVKKVKNVQQSKYVCFDSDSKKAHTFLVSSVLQKPSRISKTAYYFARCLFFSALKYP